MAKSGSLLTNGWYSSSKGDYIYLEFSWTATQSIVDNTSTISWTLKGKRTASGYVMAGAFKVVLDGETVYDKSRDYRIELRNGTVVASGTKTLTHNTDGTRSFSVSIQGALYDSAVNATGSTTFTIDTIPRKATITAATDFTDVGNPSISFNNPGGFTMDVWLEPNPIGPHLCERKGIPNTGSYTWTLTAAEREALRSSCPKESCTIRLGIYTYIGGVQYSDYADKTFTMTENDMTRPTVSLNLSVPGEQLPSEFNGLYIQGKTAINASLSADGKYGAGIQSIYVKMEGQTYYSTNGKITTDVVKNAGAVQIVAYAKDARGFTGVDQENIHVIEYSKPNVYPIAFRCNSSGDSDPEGAYMRVGFTSTISSVNNKNAASYSITYSSMSGSGTLTGTGTSFTSNAIACDVSQVWSVEVKVTDKLDSTTKAAVIPIAFTLMDFYNTGKGIAFGKVATRDGFDCAMDAYFTSAVTMTEGLTIGNKNVAAFVTEYGTSGIWTYRKWSNGIAECWGTSATVTMDSWKEWGGMYTAANVIPSYTYPVQFASAPMLQITYRAIKNGGLHYVEATGTATHTPTVSVMRGTVGNGSQGCVHLYAIGTLS